MMKYKLVIEGNILEKEKKLVTSIFSIFLNDLLLSNGY